MSTPIPESRRRPWPRWAKVTGWSAATVALSVAFGPVWWLAPILVGTVAFAPSWAKSTGVTFVDDGAEEAAALKALRKDLS